MLREIAHFVRQVPRGLAMKARHDQASLYEAVMEAADAAGLAERRAALARDLRGRVLELGAGTGRMFRHYPPDVDLVAIEPDADFAARAARAKDAARCSISLVAGSGEELPFDDESFDAAVVALVLCSVGEPARVVRELRRVLRPGAELRLMEHVVSEKPVAGALMRAVDPLWLRLNGQGCHIDRDPLPILEEGGFAVETTEPFQVFSPILPAFPMRLIRARRA